MTTRDRADLAGKLVASPGNCADQVAICREYPAQCRDLGWQIVLVDNPTWPDTLQQRLLSDDGAARFDQHHQHIERTSAQLHRPVVGEQLAAMQQHPEPAEVDCCWRFGCGVHQERRHLPDRWLERGAARAAHWTRL